MAVNVQDASRVAPINPLPTAHLGAGATTLYTAPDGGAAQLSTMTLTNTSGTEVSVQVAIQTAAGDTFLVATTSVAAGASTSLSPLPLWLPEWSVLQATASAAGVDAVCSGLEYQT